MQGLKVGGVLGPALVHFGDFDTCSTLRQCWMWCLTMVKGVKIVGFDVCEMGGWLNVGWEGGRGWGRGCKCEGVLGLWGWERKCCYYRGVVRVGAAWVWW